MKKFIFRLIRKNSQYHPGPGSLKRGKVSVANNRPTILAMGFLLILVLGVLDVLTGGSFSIFYLVPICLVAMYIGRSPGVLLACFGAAVWLVVELVDGPTYSNPLVHLWNMATRLFVFVLVAWLFSEIRLRDARRRALERIFFHDILNLISGVRGFAEYLQERASADQRDICATIRSASDQIIQEIGGQRGLSAAQDHELLIEPSLLASPLVLDQILEWYRYQKAGDVDLRLAAESEELSFTSDLALLNRVLGNMVKNAMEAAQVGDTVTIGCRKSGEKVMFWVHNPQYIPLSDQARIFKPFFSTKGQDRGLGTYSMRILSRSLGGEVSFTTSQKDGTTFQAKFPLKFPWNNQVVRGQRRGILTRFAEVQQRRGEINGEALPGTRSRYGK